MFKAFLKNTLKNVAYILGTSFPSFYHLHLNVRPLFFGRQDTLHEIDHRSREPMAYLLFNRGTAEFTVLGIIVTGMGTAGRWGQGEPC